MLISLYHRTTFSYAGKAHDSFNEVRLKPVDDPNQARRSFDLRVDPAATVREYLDFYGNTVSYFDVTAEHDRLVIEATSEVETTPNTSRPAIPPAMLSEGEGDEMRAEFLAASPFVPLDPSLWKEAQDALAGGRLDVWSDVRRICGHAYRVLEYKPRSTAVNTKADEALSIRAGVCQDFAHVALGMCRTSGIACRYVSGYFINVERRPGETEASHAWIEAHVPGFGWAPFDPTHDRAADDRYVKVASGRDYADIRPVNGTYRGGKTRSLSVEVRLRESQAAGSPG
ncbi:MAG TPA: transglutaminase family protein [Opitutaceae bacterium]|jgi:transglutaminase-like putative cysteine protease